MKKVIALALALVMVCTMALAVTINVGGDDAYAAAPGTYGQVVPGSVLYSPCPIWLAPPASM